MIGSKEKNKVGIQVVRDKSGNKHNIRVKENTDLRRKQSEEEKEIDKERERKHLTLH